MSIRQPCSGPRNEPLAFIGQVPLGVNGLKLGDGHVNVAECASFSIKLFWLEKKAARTATLKAVCTQHHKSYQQEMHSLHHHPEKN